jgi:hypothetical protein
MITNLVHSAIIMRFNFIYLLAVGNAVSCLPHSSFPDENAKLQGRGEVDVQDTNPNGALKASAVAGLSLAGIIAASIGATEYISSLYHRFSKGKIESLNETGDKKFNRDRQLVDEDIQDAGIDIVLDLIEKYAHERETAVMPAETSVGESERDEDSESEAATTTVEKRVDMALPLPRLPGHPPLSSFTEG